MPLLSSPLPLLVLLALTQRGVRGASLRELARATGVRDSSAQHALGVLVKERLIVAEGTLRGRSYRLAANAQAERFVRLSLDHLPREDTLGVLVRANEGVEFASYRKREGELFVVYTNHADAADEVRLREMLARIESEPRVRLRDSRHDQVIAAILEDPSVRQRALAGVVLKGRPQRSLPDRRRRGDFERARRLGRPHPQLAHPSRRRLADLARRYGLAQIGLFGSAVRDDFRPDSDVDVLVRYRPGFRKSLRERVALEHELERLFERDVDVVDEDALGEPVRQRALGEAVALLT